MKSRRLEREKQKAGLPSKYDRIRPVERDYLTHPDSVQVKYRPVLQAPIPDPPEEGEVGTERAIWWQTQLYRCKYGWTYEAEGETPKYFTPAYYFYLNFVKVEIKDKKRGRKRMAPLYSDSDHRIFNWIYSLEAQAYSMARDGIVTKGRRKHWSYITHCGVFLHDFCFDTASHVAIGYDSKISREEGQRIFQGAYNSLPSYFKHDTLYTEKEGELSNGEAVYDADGQLTGYVERNTIIFRELDKNPGGLRGRNLKRVLLDEIGKYRNAMACVIATEDALREGLDKHGSLLAGGTSDAISNESKDYKTLWKQADVRGWGRLFVSAGWVAPPYFDYFTGVSDIKAAEAEYRAERDALLNVGDVMGYYGKMQENPLTPEECFNPPVRSRYPAHIIQEQVFFLRQWPTEHWIIRGRLDWVNDVLGNHIRVDFTEDPNGSWHFYRDGFPRRDLPGLDILGVDDVYLDKEREEVSDDDSLQSIVIKRRKVDKQFENDLFVAYYEDRHDRHVFARELHKALWFTNGKAIIENNDKFLPDFLQRNNLQDQVIWVNGKMGIRNDERTIPHQQMLAQDWFDAGGASRCYFERILDSFKNFRSTNDDVASAAHLALHAEDIIKDHPIRTEADAKGFGLKIGTGYSPLLARMTGLQDTGLNGESGSRLDGIRRMREQMRRVA
ncbi:hypothetical protein [Spirosoma sordidisoli]|uniref:Terminase n=1 Tax=Spirosoma sordidisoli TaxID=2502893 RepID=A0A4Q2UJH3_9BACT|nr:hypothetical protein [Spirosoma sordidisoli]RYC69637.1 hypothetical protein EQG79_13635 [Spirosoma sordidisoli]